MDNRNNRALLSTTRRSFNLIEYLMENDGATLAELDEAFDMAKSTIHNHLQTLLSMEYLIQRGKKYHIGLRFFSLGERARSRNPHLMAARKHVHELAKEIDEDVSFCVEEHDRLVSIQHTVGDNPSMKFLPSRREFYLSGKIFNLHSTAAGKAILATYTNEEIREFLEKRGLPPETSHTITDPERLLAEIEQVRERGWALVDEEYREGLRAISATATSPDNQTLGAMSISVPTYRSDIDTLTPYTTRLTNTLNDLEEELERMERQDSR